jgi:peptidoglycan/LPS O-acetylase OafA/YrhL
MGFIMAKGPELTGLTALRLFAASFVLLFHSRYFAENSWLEIPIFALFSSGGLGVDIFFVLSGFVISYVYAENLNLGRYMLHRTARIYPLYLITTIAALIAISILGRPAYAEFDNFDILMNLVMLQGWYTDFKGSVNFVSWTVSAEWAIYLIFPAIIWIIKVLPVNWLGIMLPVSVYAFFGGLASAGLAGPINKCLFLFCSGVMLFRYWKEFGVFGSWVKVAAIFSLLAMISLEAWFSYFGHPISERNLSVFAVPIVAWGIVWKTKNSLLIIGGRASYSIYLVHGVVYLVLRRCIELGVLDRTWGLPLFLLLSIGIALITYFWIEQPGRRWILKIMTFAKEKTID